MESLMNAISWVANGFMSLFQAGGETFMGWVTGIIPMVICLMTAINSVIKLIGEERVERFAKKMTGNIFGRYLVLPVLAVMFLGNPMCYTFGRFVDEKYKPAYYDSSAYRSCILLPACSRMPTRANCSSTWALQQVSPNSACRWATWPSGISLLV